MLAPMKTYTVRYSASSDPAEGVVIEDFCFPWTDAPCPLTQFSAVWGPEHFHFRFDVVDHDLVLDESGEPGQAVLGSDRVELFFSPTRDLSTYYGIEMEPRGEVYDYRAHYHRRFDREWRFPGLEFSGKIRESGYSVEGRIPLSVLRDLSCLRDSEMIVGVYRGEFSHGADGIIQDWISWIHPQTEVPDFHVPASFGTFLFESEKARS